jgi:decaprenylphospho-beta-D-erythro-pentofuranosid-2-ulose 2-reductase
MRDGLGDVQTVLLLGGTSEIGLAIARRLAGPRRAAVVLAGRDPAALEAAAATLRAAAGGDSTSGNSTIRDSTIGEVSTLAFDALATADHDGVIESASQLLGDLDVVILAFGLLGDQTRDETEEGSEGAVRVAQVNYVGAVSAGLAAARRLRIQGHGTLVVLSSVAGERVRKANYIYGSSKAGLDGFVQGLGDSLHGSGAGVLIVRPGFVTTKMTTGMKPPPLSTTADKVADATDRALRQGREVVWVPGPFRWVMMVMRHLPRPIFRRLPF